MMQRQQRLIEPTIETIDCPLCGQLIVINKTEHDVSLLFTEHLATCEGQFKPLDLSEYINKDLV